MTKHHLTPEMAVLLVRHSQKSNDTLTPLMRDLAAHRDMASMTSLGDAIKAAPPDTVARQAMLETIFAPVGWGLQGSEDEKNFEAEWIAKWQPKPTLALESLMGMAALVKKGKGQEIDVGRMVAMVDMARPLLETKGRSLAAVFSPFVDQMLDLVDLPNKKQEQAALQVIEKVFSLEPQTLFRLETSTPEFDLSKRPKNAPRESAAGLTFRITSHNLIAAIHAKSIAVQSKLTFLDFLDGFYSPELMKIQAHDFVRTEKLDVSLSFGMETELLKRGWLSGEACNDLLKSPVVDQTRQTGAKTEEIPGIYAVALVAHSLKQKDIAIEVLTHFRAAGANLDQSLDCPRGKLVFHGTLLHFAAMQGHADFVVELIKSGCDPSKRMTTSVAETGLSRGKEGFTAVQLAALELEKFHGDPANEPKRQRLESIVSILRSQNARAAAHQMLNDMDDPSPSAGAKDHASGARL